VPEDDEKQDDERRPRTLVKMIITMKRSKNFFEIVEPLDD